MTSPPTHTCHADGCKAPVPPRMFMCRPHWYALPKSLRDELWAVYRRGQEVTKDPSPEYLAVARKCIDFLAAKASQSQEARRAGMCPGIRSRPGPGNPRLPVTTPP